MLEKKHRLPATTRLKNSTFYKTPLFTVKIANNDLELSRFAFVVRKAVDKRAVVRNRIRRVFRSCIEQMLGEIKSGQDMLFILEKGLIDKPQQELCGELREFLRERNLLGVK